MNQASSDDNSSAARLPAEDRQALLRTATDSIAHGLRHGRPLAVNTEKFSEPLRLQRASFVTLEMHDQLRGCIGMLEAVRPLIVDVAENAYAAAFRDPRFMPVTVTEFPDLTVHISILSPPEPISFADQDDLLRQIRPNVDGLILADGQRRGTFLPAVWESLPEPEEFLRHLKLKAGLPAEHWSDTVKVWRYTTESVP